MADTDKNQPALNPDSPVIHDAIHKAATDAARYRIAKQVALIYISGQKIVDENKNPLSDKEIDEQIKALTKKMGTDIGEKLQKAAQKAAKNGNGEVASEMNLGGKRVEVFKLEKTSNQQELEAFVKERAAQFADENTGKNADFYEKLGEIARVGRSGEHLTSAQVKPLADKIKDLKETDVNDPVNIHPGELENIIKPGLEYMLLRKIEKPTKEENDRIMELFKKLGPELSGQFASVKGETSAIHDLLNSLNNGSSQTPLCETVTLKDVRPQNPKDARPITPDSRVV